MHAFSVHFLGHSVQSVPLRYVKHVLGWWLVKHSAVDGPEAAQDSEQRAFSTTVRARDQQMHAFINLERKTQHPPYMLLKTHERTCMQRIALHPHREREKDARRDKPRETAKCVYKFSKATGLKGATVMGNAWWFSKASLQHNTLRKTDPSLSTPCHYAKAIHSPDTHKYSSTASC